MWTISLGQWVIICTDRNKPHPNTKYNFNPNPTLNNYPKPSYNLEPNHNPNLKVQVLRGPGGYLTQRVRSFYYFVSCYAREEGVVALHLPNGSLKKTRSGVEPVWRCEPSGRRFSHCAIGAGNDRLRTIA